MATDCDLMAESFGWTGARRRWLRRAALLHDIGKLGVSNSILDKPDKLDDAEWAKIRQHPAYTMEILSRIEPFREMAFIAGAHHERLDGKGYPWGLAHDQIPLETRMITVADIFDAISADRPYRSGMPMKRVCAIMDDLAGPSIDPECWAALRSCLPDPCDTMTLSAWPLEREARELERVVGDGPASP